MVRSARDLFDHIHYLVTLVDNGGQVIVPGSFAESLYSFVVCFFGGSKLKVRDDALIYHPLAHFCEAVKLLLEFESFGRFISFVTSRGAVTLRLRHVNDMHKGRDVILTRDLGGAEIGFEERRVIPGVDSVMIESVLNFFEWKIGIALKAFEQCADIFLHHLKLVWDGNAVTVVIDRDDCGSFEYANRIDRFPKETFRC